MVTDALYEPYRNEALARFQKKLSPSSKLPYYGISMPNLRALAKTTKFDEIEIKYHEDVILKGLSLALEKGPFKEKICFLDSLLCHLSSWDHTDTIASAFKSNALEKDDMFSYFSSLLMREETFIRRLGIVWLMANRHSIDYDAALKLIVDADKEDDYYVMMAVSWALSFYFFDGKDISKELDIVSETTRKKAIQKIKESQRQTKTLTLKR